MSMGGTTIKSQEYTTDDSVDKVLAFYKDKLGPTAMVYAKRRASGGASHRGEWRNYHCHHARQQPRENEDYH